MTQKPRVLLVEDDPEDARWISGALSKVVGARFHVDRTERLSEALDRLREGTFDAVLLDLSLPDREGLATFLAVQTQAPDVPIVVLSGHDSRSMALRAVQEGAQDYLVKHSGMEELLVRALTNAIERKRVEIELRQAKEAAETADRAKSRFVAVVSHELRAPMSAIVGYAELLGDTALDAEQQGYLTRLGRSAQALLSLTNDLLDLMSVEEGRLELLPSEVEVGGLIDEVADSMELEARRKSLTLIRELAPDVPPRLVADRGRLRQVLVNLVGNAIKFTEHGRVNLGVSVVEQEGSNALLRFTVADTGMGIPPERLDEIFAPFVQGDGSIRERFGGSGLGLAVSKRLIERMGGAIRVESQLGIGTTFSFTVSFPVPKGETAQGEQDLRDVAVLIVDDESSEREALGACLVARGARVEEVDNGAEAILRLKRTLEPGRAFRLILLDCRMPSLGGFQVAEALRDHPEVLSRTVVLLPPEAREGDRTRAEAMGMAGVLRKPVGPVELRRVVDRVVLGRQAPPPEPAMPPVLGGARRILLAEDSSDVRQLVQLFLRGTGFEVDVAENGRVAVEKFVTRGYDLVLMDVQMPEMDGHAATAAIRRWEHEQGAGPVPILALTAHAMKEEVQKTLAAGCTAHLSKPITKDQLLSAVRRHTTLEADPVPGS